MTTQPEQAVGNESPVELSPEDRLNAAFADPANHQEDELPEEGAEGDEPPVAEETDDEPELEAEDDELPPIDAPVSWDAEAKERFAKYSREDQEYISKRESERERFVQQKSQEAARAKTETERAALQQLAQIDQTYSQQYQQAAHILEQLSADPDYSLLATNPAEFARQAENAKYFRTQLQQVQSRASHHAQQAQQAEQEAEQAFHAEQHQKIVEQFPEYLDPTNRPKLQAELTNVAKELGYPDELIAQARADDLLAMKTANEWRNDALKYRNLMAKKMEKVREAKKLPPVAKPGVAQAPGAARTAQYASDRDAMRRGDRDATTRVLDSFFTKP